jgi:hypothetical protein
MSSLLVAYGRIVWDVWASTSNPFPSSLSKMSSSGQNWVRWWPSAALQHQNCENCIQGAIHTVLAALVTDSCWWSISQGFLERGFGTTGDFALKEQAYFRGQGTDPLSPFRGAHGKTQGTERHHGLVHSHAQAAELLD